MTAAPAPATIAAPAPATIAARELFYLARVGAFRYLDGPREALQQRRLGAEQAPPVPEDHGLIPRPATSRGGTPPGLRNLTAFKVYAAAERAALAALERVTDPAELAHIAKRLGDGIAEGEQARANLIRKDHPVPGRGAWLVPDDEGNSP